MATIEEIKELRERTGAGVNAVREALDSSKGDLEEAMRYLRKKGVAKADKRKDKQALNGVLGTYVHANNKLVVVVEVACETDFAAKNEVMIEFANQMALQIAAMNAEFITEEDVSEDAKTKLRETAEKDLAGKPEEVKEKIIEGKMQKYFEEVVLLNQPLFTDDSKAVKDLLDELVAKIGEKIEISRFVKVAVADAPTTCNLG